MSQYTAVAIINVAIISLVAFGIYTTQSLWMLLALLFLFRTKSKNEKED